MSQEYSFDTYHEFEKKYEELRKEGITREQLHVYAPNPVHGFDNLIQPTPSRLRIFTLVGALSGTAFGFGFTIFTVLSWPIITGGKPIVSIPPFVIIAFELTILFGAVISFLGFLFLSRLPSVRNMLDVKEYGNKFVIIVDKDMKVKK